MKKLTVMTINGTFTSYSDVYFSSEGIVFFDQNSKEINCPHNEVLEIRSYQEDQTCSDPDTDKYSNKIIY